jgi:thioredoxin-related protein
MKSLLLLTAGLLFTVYAESPAHEHDEDQASDPKTEWLEIETAQELSKEDGNPVFLFFEAEWCGTCKRMLRNVFPQYEVTRLLSESYHTVSIDLESRKEILFNGRKISERNLAREFEVQATPTLLFLDSSGEELGRFLGFLDQDDFKRLLVYITSEQFNEISFEEFTIPGQ